MAEQSDSRWLKGEAIPGVVTVGDPLLRRSASAVSDPRAAKALCETLVTKLRELKGAGIAANQIASPDAVVVVEVRKTDLFPDRPESPLYLFVNPEIVERKGEAALDWEGCFSVPGLMGQVNRAEAVKVRYETPDAEQREEWFEGYVARVIQHEYDHLQGRLFLDRMGSLESLTTSENYRKFHFHP